MILFLGTRPGKTISQNLDRITCPHCNQRNTLQGNITPNYFHLFWIPIWKINTAYFVRCSYCKAAFFKDEFTPEMRRYFELN